MQSNYIDKKCHFCNLPISVKPSKLKARNFCSHKCWAKYRAEDRTLHSCWNGGRNITPDGYIRIHKEGGGYILEHRLIVESALGRPLLSSEVVHHVDGDKANNSLNNLFVTSQPEHMRLHVSGKWSRDYDSCQDCDTSESPHDSHGRCARCADRYRNPGRKHILTTEVVAEIKSLLSRREMTQTAIAKLYGTSPQNITAIKTGRSWNSVSSRSSED